MLFCSLFFRSEAFGQTYTSNSNGNWNNASRWTITNTAGCGSPIPNTPPVATNNRACPINIVINHNVNGLNDLNIGNNNQVSIQIAANRTLTINRDLLVTGFNNKSLTLSGSGDLVVGRDFLVNGNSRVTISGDLDINVDDITEITEAAQFEADGNIQFFSDRITIDGDGALNFSALSNSIFESTATNRDFTISNDSNVIFSGTSGIISNRDIIIDGNTPDISFEDDSYMESRDLILFDGGTLQMNDNASLSIDRDFEIDDSFTIEFFGDSELNIGREMFMLGNSQIILNENSILFVGDHLELEDGSTIILYDDALMTITDNTDLVDQSKILGYDNSQIILEGQLFLDVQSTLSLADNSSLLVQEDVEVTTDNLVNGIRFSGNSSGSFDSDVLFDGTNSTLNLSDDAIVTVSGSFDAEGGADIFLNNSANLTLNSTLTLNNSGTTLNLTGDSEIVILGSSNIDGGADVSLTGNSNVNFKGNLSFDNTSGTTWTNSQTSYVLVEGNFAKGPRSSLTIRNSGVFEICAGIFPDQVTDSNIVTDPAPAYYGGCRILPVEFVSFNVIFKANSRSAFLDWSTAKEWQNSHFEIERSLNSINGWKTIDIVLGNGFTDEIVNYNFIDQELPLLGGNIYYRLKQVDENGNSSYSNTKAIQVEPLHSNKNWKLYPNPTNGNSFKLELIDPSAFGDEIITVRIISPIGNYQIFSNSDSNEISNEIQEFLMKSSAGIYIIQINWGKNKEVHKIIRH